MRRIVIILAFVYISCQLSAQLNGGPGDGFSMIELTSTTEIYNGGFGDGFDMKEVESGVDFFVGGPGDGFDMKEVESELEFFVGGMGDGFSMQENLGNSSYFYTGGSGDGYSTHLLCATFTWTGAVGVSWNLKANWQQNELPCNCNPVIIPANTVNDLGVNAGTLVIGHASNDVGDYKAQSITVEENAYFLTRINCFVENYGKIEVFGFWNAKNQANNSFLNYGEIIIGENGTLKVGN